MVYTLNGRTEALYVRSEIRAGSKDSEHLFVHVKDRVVMFSWLEKMPPEADLIIDVPARAELNESSWLVELAGVERGIALKLLAKVCEWLPPSKAAELRAEWKAAHAEI